MKKAVDLCGALEEDGVAMNGKRRTHFDSRAGTPWPHGPSVHRTAGSLFLKEVDHVQMVKCIQGLTLAEKTS